MAGNMPSKLSPNGLALKKISINPVPLVPDWLKPVAWAVLEHFPAQPITNFMGEIAECEGD